MLAYNFLKQSSFICTEEILAVLHHLSEWQPVETLRNVLPELTDDELNDSIEALAGVGGVIIKGSEEAEIEHKKVDRWEWGIPSAMLHYGEQDRNFQSREAAEAIQIERQGNKAQPPLFELNTKYRTVHQLAMPVLTLHCTSIMRRRRTIREVHRSAISLQVLSDCLFSGMGITGSVKNCVGELPLSMTPSGGARNPYEAYVYVSRVTGLDPGFYHYSAKEHSLGLVKKCKLDAPSQMVGDQKWIDDMSTIVFLCANFERSMWKYQDNNAYRVILIEAGHIAQNMMLTATEHGLTACPSAALAHSHITEHLGFDGGLQSPIYALMLGKPKIPLSVEPVSDVHHPSESRH